jgi:hypothetical protein
MQRKRKEKFDNRRRVDFNDTQADFCDSKSDELGLSFMAYIRKLVNEEMARDKELSQPSEQGNTSISGQNRTSPDGLLTAEQVAQVIGAAMKWRGDK